MMCGRQGSNLHATVYFASVFKTDVCCQFHHDRIVPQEGLEPSKAQFLRPEGVPVSISHRGIEVSLRFELRFDGP